MSGKNTPMKELSSGLAPVIEDVPELSEDEEVDQSSNINLPPPELSEEEMEIEDKGNLQPADLPQPDENIIIKEPDFPAPVIEVPEEPKESRILSPKKGVKRKADQASPSIRMEARQKAAEERRRKRARNKRLQKEGSWIHACTELAGRGRKIDWNEDGVLF